MPLRIRDWDETFETRESRRRKGPLKWVAMPVRMAGLRYRRIMRRENGAEIYGVFCVLMGIAATCPVRGELTDDHGHDLTIDDISDISGIPNDVITRSLQVLCSPEIAWINGTNLYTTCTPSVHSMNAACTPPVQKSDSTVHNSTVHNITDSPKGESLVDCESKIDRPEVGQPPEGPGGRRNASAVCVFSRDVEAIYQAYPRKAGKAAALRSIEMAIKAIRKGQCKPEAETFWPPTDAVAWLKNRVAEFAKSPRGTAGTYTPHPATWFNQGRYADDPAEWQLICTGRQKEEPEEDEDAMVRRLTSLIKE